MRVCPCSKMKYQLLNCLVLSRLHSAQTCTILPVLPGSCIIHPSLHLTIIAACFTWTRLPLTTVLIIFHILTSKPKSHSYISCSVLSQFAKSAFLPQSALMGNLPFFLLLLVEDFSNFSNVLFIFMLDPFFLVLLPPPPPPPPPL